MEKVKDAAEDGVYVRRTQWGFSTICVQTYPG